MAPSPTSTSRSVVSGTDGRPRGDRCRALQRGAGQQRHVGRQVDRGVHPGRRRVDHSDSAPHPSQQDPAIHLGVHRRQLDSVVDPLGLPQVAGDHGADRPAGPAGQAEHVGQIQLILIVGRRQVGQSLLQGLRVEDVDARVDLGDHPLVVVGVAMLDDCLDQVVCIAQDPPVSGRVRHLGGEHGDRGLPVAVFGQQPGQGLPRQHRHVAVGDDHLTVEIAERVQGDLDRVPGAALFFLDRGRDVRGDLRQMGLDLVTQVADHHHHPLRLDRGRRGHGIAEQRMPGDLVQQLGSRGLHPLALARCQDDDGSDRARASFGGEGQPQAPYVSNAGLASLPG